MALVPRNIWFVFYFLYDFCTEKIAEVDFVSANEGCMKLVLHTRIQVFISFTETFNVVVSEFFIWFSLKNRTLQEQFNGVKRKVQHDRAACIIGLLGRSFQDCA